MRTQMTVVRISDLNLFVRVGAGLALELVSVLSHSITPEPSPFPPPLPDESCPLVCAAPGSAVSAKARC
jgi:hypothetical protein